MKQNMNIIERIVRLFIAALFGFFFLVSHLTGGWAVGCLVIVFFLSATAFLGRCPLYRLTGMGHAVPKKPNPSTGPS